VDGSGKLVMMTAKLPRTAEDIEKAMGR